LHQVGVLFDLYYDARKHKIKIDRHNKDVWCAVHIVKLPMTALSPPCYFLTFFLSTLPSFLKCERPSFRQLPNRI